MKFPQFPDSVRSSTGLVAAGLLLLVVGCSANTPTVTGSYRLTLMRGDGSAALDVLDTEHNSLLNLPAGTLSPDGSRLYATAVDRQGAATLKVLDTRSGALLAARPISTAALSTPGIMSARGGWLAARQPEIGGQTRIAVFNASSLVEHDIRLDGVFTLDAISDSGRLLYLLETVATDTYRVRDYDLVKDVLDATVIVDKTDASPIMSGIRVASVSVAGSELVMTLYRRPGKAPFIHLLQVPDKVAFCIDLPEAGPSTSGPSGWSLLLDEARSRVYAINSGGLIAEVAYRNFSVNRSVAFKPSPTASWTLPFVTDAFAGSYSDPGAGFGRPAISLDGSTLFVPDRAGYMTIPVKDLRPSGRRMPGRDLTSLAMSPDGLHLFAVEPMANRVLELDAMTGNVLRTFAAPQPGSILRIDQS